MRKIPSQFECPIDNFLIDIAKPYLDYFHKNGVTPNILTTMGNIIRAISIYNLFQGNLYIFFILYIWGFQFDCLDGYFARSYDMCTTLGDVYDHVSDTIFGVFLFYYLWQTTWVVIGIYLYFLFMMQLHIGCAQIHYNGNENKEYLDIFKMKFYKKEWVIWTRYFGCGTFIVVSSFLVFV